MWYFSKLSLVVSRFDTLFNLSIKLNYVEIFLMWHIWYSHPKTSWLTVNLRTKLRKINEIDMKKKLSTVFLLSHGLKLNHVEFVMIWFSRLGQSKNNLDNYKNNPKIKLRKIKDECLTWGRSVASSESKSRHLVVWFSVTRRPEWTNLIWSSKVRDWLWLGKVLGSLAQLTWGKLHCVV